MSVRKSDVHFERVVALASSGQTVQSMREFDMAIRLDPDNSECHIFGRHSCTEMGYHRRADVHDS